MKRESWLQAEPESAGTARALVREAAVEQGFDGEATWDLMLATSEAVANAVIHGRACGSGEDAIRMRMQSCDDGLCVEICDCGGFDGVIEQVPLEAIGGRGLHLITAVTDVFELTPETSSTRVRFGKRRVAQAA